MTKKKWYVYFFEFALAYAFVYAFTSYISGGLTILLVLIVVGGWNCKEELDTYKLMFDIADKELVRVSALTTELQERLDNLGERASP